MFGSYRRLNSKARARAEDKGLKSPPGLNFFRSDLALAKTRRAGQLPLLLAAGRADAVFGHSLSRAPSPPPQIKPVSSSPPLQLRVLLLLLLLPA